MLEGQETEESKRGRERWCGGEGSRERVGETGRDRERQKGREITDMMTSLESMKTLGWLHPGLPSDTSQ